MNIEKRRKNMTALDKISDFDEVMQFFERMLNFTKNKLRNNILL